MKLHDYTYQSGHCLVDDTESAILGPEIFETILGLIREGSGLLPSVPGVGYRWTEADGVACLSVDLQTNPPSPIWLALVVAYQGEATTAVAQLDMIAEHFILAGYPMDCNLPDHLATPCVITLLLPGVTMLPRETVHLLGGVPRDFACVWLSHTYGM